MTRRHGKLLFLITLVFIFFAGDLVADKEQEKKKEPIKNNETSTTTAQTEGVVGTGSAMSVRVKPEKGDFVTDDEVNMGMPGIEVAYVNGKPHGKAILRYKNGTKVEGEYNNGLKTGLWITYDKQGRKYSQESYKDGKKDGKSIRWDEDGYVNETDYKDGLFHGKKKCWDKNGKLISEHGYKDGKPHGRHIVWYPNGDKLEEGYFNDGTGKIIFWYPSGKKSTEMEFKDGKKYGKEISWYESGQKKNEQTYNEEGKNIGKSTYWNRDGKVVREEEFDQNGQRLYYKEYDEEGNLTIDNDQSVDKKKTTNKYATIPRILDLRTLNKVTEVKDQDHGNWSNTCWAFGYIGALESHLMPASPLPDPNYSEQHLADKNHGWDPNGLSQGGRLEMALAYFTRNGGPINETSMPYNPVNPLGKQISIPARKWIREIQRNNNNASWTNGNDAFCQLHMNTSDNGGLDNGGVAGILYFNDDQFDGEDYYWYSTNTTDPCNHTVVLVGWNYDYSRTNFPAHNGHLPYQDGALIVKNSWGATWSSDHDGYFYISMDTLRFYPNTAFTDVGEPIKDVVDPTLGNYIYQYDLLGLVTNIEFDTSGDTSACTYANIFTAENPIGTIDNLKAVGFFLPWDQLGICDFNYTVTVYTNLTDASNPSSGIQAAGPISGKDGWFQYGGYYTQDLPNPVPIKGGSKFSIVVKNSRNPYWQKCGFAVEERFSNPVSQNDPHPLSALNASSKSGESFLWTTTGWQDFKLVGFKDMNNNVVLHINACIKAFTDGNFDHYWKLKEALDNQTLNVTSDNGYNLNWTRVIIESDENDAARSGWISAGERCHLDATIEGPKLISFYWKVSSDPGNNLKFYVDGVETRNIGGNVDLWRQEQINIPTSGIHKIEWSYEKIVNASTAVEDCGWVDNFCQASDFKIISPNGGEGLPIGAKLLITWICGDITGNLSIELFQNDALIGLIAEVPATPGRYLWDVGTWTGGQVSPGTGYKIRISTADGTLLKARLQTVK